MHYAEYPAPPPLDTLVRCLWTLRDDPPTAATLSPAPPTGASGDTDAVAEPALPDGSPELIINLGDPFEHVEASGAARRQPRAFLVGQITQPMVVRPTGRVDLIAVRLEAYGAHILCDAMHALTDRWADVDALEFPALSALSTRLAALDDDATRTALVCECLEAIARRGRSPDVRVVEAVRALRTTHGMMNLETLYRSLAVSPRTLQRLFARQVGISPKLLARILRFQRVVRAWREDARSLGRVAAECGYFDQSHLVRDFRDFAGAPPAGFLAELPSFTAHFLK